MQEKKPMCCVQCGSRLVDGKCKVKWCDLFNDSLRQILASGQLPFGQKLTSNGLGTR